MKKHLAVLAGLGGPLLAAPGAAAEFQGISFEERPNEFGIKAFRLYAEFDEPGDHMLACWGDQNSPAHISVTGGTYFQHQFGSIMPPNPVFFEFAPDLRYDTFVTIGVESFNFSNPGVPEGQPENSLVLTPGFPGFTPTTLDLTRGPNHKGAWAVVPTSPQGDPFNPAFVAGDGRALIAQLATVDGTGFEGLLNIHYLSGGVLHNTSVKFSHIIAECPWDLDGDGAIGVIDFLSGLAQWGTDPGGPPDFDGDGDVGILDFLELLVHWGPCP